MVEKLAVVSGQWAENERQQAVKRLLPTAHCPLPASSSRGFTLIELVMTLMVLSVLAMGVIPLVKASVRRQREQRLREALLQMRTAIDEFKRDTVGMQCAGAATTPTAPVQPGAPGVPNPGAYIDPRSRVVVSDCTIFNTSNIDRYPPDLETLVNGVSVIPRAGAGQTLGSGPSGPAATENTLTSTKKKVYLREIPVDPMTGERSWDLRSSFDSANSGSWGGENVFDVRSKSNETAMNGEKYNEW
jgi:general secretion pathway protein G